MFFFDNENWIIYLFTSTSLFLVSISVTSLLFGLFNKLSIGYQYFSNGLRIDYQLVIVLLFQILPRTSLKNVLPILSVIRSFKLVNEESWLLDPLWRLAATCGAIGANDFFWL
jgi:hypothetical protein